MQNKPLAKWLRIFVHLSGVLPLLFLALGFFRSTLGFNPVETVLHRTGRWAVVFLILSLACTPVNKFFKLPMVGKLKKPLGLYAALYALLHFAAFAVWDYRLNVSLIWMEMTEKPFIIIGAIALIILLILGATSFRFWQRKLGKWWLRLHHLAYAAGILAVVHYLLAVKGDLLSLQGAYTAPLIAAGVLLLLLIFRLPSVTQFIRHRLNRG